MSIRKYISFCLILLLIAPTIFPTTTSALELIDPIPIKESVLRAKEGGLTVLGRPIPGTSLDAIATMIVKRSIESIVDSTVDWINSGFDGNPAFVDNPAQHFANIADQIGGEFIEGIGASGICSPFQVDITLSLQTYYASRYGRYQEPVQCTLSEAVGNIEAFYNDFAEGGWRGWFSMTQNSGNNPYGAYLNAQALLDSRITNALKLEEDDLNRGQGFLSLKDSEGNIKTPGVVIETQLQNVLGTGVRQLELADEFDELIGALVGQLLQRTVFSQNGLNSGEGSDDDQPNTPNPQVVVACGPVQGNITLGESALWIAESSLRNPTYTWYGEGVEGRTTPSVSVIYSTTGTKTASIIVNGTDTNGQARTAPAECENPVTVSTTDQGIGNTSGTGLGSGGVNPI